MKYRIRPQILLVAALAVALVLAGHWLGAGSIASRSLDAVGHLGALAPIAFVAIYIVACVLFIPGSILTIGAGALFGVVWGSVYVSIASIVGATCAFLVGRYLARDWVAAKIETNPKFLAIDEAVAREGWKIVGLTRLSPVFPFNLLNYAFGLTRVSLRDYVFASWAGMLPGTVMYVYIGSIAGDLARATSQQNPASAARWTLNLIGFAATAGVTVYVARIGAKALQRKTS